MPTINCTLIRDEYYRSLALENDARGSSRPKKSFWPSDCLKPNIEIFWQWMGIEPTNPITADKLNMFKVANACEVHVIKQLQKIGYAADLEDDEVVKRLGVSLSPNRDEFGRRQIRVEMEREFCPWTGYMDGIMPDGTPIEVKSTASSQYERMLSLGKPPNENYLHQLACYMDYIGSDRGVLITIGRGSGSMFFTELIHLGEGIYQTGEQSGCLPPGDDDEDDKPEIEDGDPVEDLPDVEPCTFDLTLEYKRLRTLMEDYLLQLKEPPLDYEYRPTVTKSLLDNYPEIKIKKAIKGERVLSDHIWRPQYCNWKDLWIQKEMIQKGFSSLDEMCKYSPEEIAFMMDHINVEWRETKSGKNKGQMKLFKKK